MKPEQKTLLIKAGVNYNAGLLRFMNNEALWDRFLTKFVHDKSYEILRHALDSGDYEEALRAAHTLKGVAGNLSLEILFQEVSTQTQYLRLNDLESARAILPRIDAAYWAVIRAISAE